jgi:chaperonin GroES
MATFTPLADRVAIRPDTAEETTSGGLYIPDTAKEKPRRGTVLSVGPGRFENGQNVEMSVKTGDAVLYGSYAGTEITLDGEEVLIVRESDLLGCITD